MPWMLGGTFGLQVLDHGLGRFTREDYQHDRHHDHYHPAHGWHHYNVFFLIAIAGVVVAPLLLPL